MSEIQIMPRAFYERNAVEVARDLLGKVLVHGPVSGRIVEVEAYLGLHDPAAHSARGVTARTKVIFGPPGHAYVYFIYGMYECLNIVAEPEGSPGCVLIRALEPISGIEEMKKRRGAVKLEQLTSGPGKLTMAMGIDRRLNGADVTTGELIVGDDGIGELEIGTGPRVGISKAVDWPLRFWVMGNRFVSRG